MTSDKRSDLGFLAESLATEFLERKNYEILDRNYRKKWGEIDVIAQKGSVIFFVEVKASKVSIPGFEPELRVNHQKRLRIDRAARTYLAQKKLTGRIKWQIDIVAISFDKERGVAKIKHFKNIDL
jgi:putative endonuclease